MTTGEWVALVLVLFLAALLRSLHGSLAGWVFIFGVGVGVGVAVTLGKR